MSIKILSNRALWYLISRYFAFGIQFLFTSVLAASLGAYSFGLWGYLLLILQYLEQINYGVGNSSNILISKDPSNKEKAQQIFSNSFVLTLVISLINSGGFFLFLYTDIFPKAYTEILSRSAIYLVAIGALFYLQTLLSNICRIYGRLLEMLVFQSVVHIVLMLILLVEREQTSIQHLLMGYLCSYLASFLFIFLRSPLQFRLKDISWRMMRAVFLKGIYLFFYATAIYFILYIFRSFVSANCSIKEFGIFSFSFTIVTAVLTLLSSFTTLIFPKMINRFSRFEEKNALESLLKFREQYLFVAGIIVLLAMLLYPYAIMFFPEYSNSVDIFALLSIALLMQFDGSIFSTFLMSKDCEKQLALFAGVSLIGTIVILLLLANGIACSYKYYTIAPFIGYIVFSYLSLMHTNKITLGRKPSLGMLFNGQFFRFSIFLPIIVGGMLLVLYPKPLLLLLILPFYILLNRETFKQTCTLLLRISKEKSFINI